MSLDVNITDTRNKKKAYIDTREGEDQALVVATRPNKIYTNEVKFFTNLSYGFNMNQDASVGGGAVQMPVHDGGDNTYWTASAIVGTWDFASTDQAQDGTQSIDASDTVNNDVAQFTANAPSGLASYENLTGYIFLAAWNDLGTDKGIDIYGWDTGLGTMVGNVVGIDDYINTDDVDNWQAFSIPLGDMGLVGKTIDAIRVETIDIGGGLPPDYYLDLLNIQGAGAGAGSLEFTVEPNRGTWYHINKLSIFMVDAYHPTATSGNIQNISYDALLGVPALTYGVNYQETSEGAIENSASLKQLSDMLQQPNAHIEDIGYDGTNTYLKVVASYLEPAVLKAEEDDKMKLILNDDLSGLLILRCSVEGKTELRS